MEKKNQVAFLFILVATAFATLAFVIWPSLNMANEQTTTQNQQVVQDFYSWYLSYEGNPLDDHAYRSGQYLSPDMVAYLDDFTQDGMAYDPVLCAQDKPSDIQVSPMDISGGQASVEVSSGFEDHKFTVVLVQIDGDWLIDQVTCKS